MFGEKNKVQDLRKKCIIKSLKHTKNCKKKNPILATLKNSLLNLLIKNHDIMQWNVHSEVPHKPGKKMLADKKEN